MQPSAIPFQMSPKALLSFFIAFTISVLIVDWAISFDHLHHWKQMFTKCIRQCLPTPFLGKPDGRRNNAASKTSEEANTAEK